MDNSSETRTSGRSHPKFINSEKPIFYLRTHLPFEVNLAPDISHLSAEDITPDISHLFLTPDISHLFLTLDISHLS